MRILMAPFCWIPVCTGMTFMKRRSIQWASFPRKRESRVPDSKCVGFFDNYGIFYLTVMPKAAPSAHENSSAATGGHKARPYINFSNKVVTPSLSRGDVFAPFVKETVS